MLSGADELDQEGIDGSDIGTVDEWHSFCDTCFPSVVRVEDLGCVGITVRGCRGRCPFWSGDARCGRGLPGGENLVHTTVPAGPSLL